MRNYVLAGGSTRFSIDISGQSIAYRGLDPMYLLFGPHTVVLLTWVRNDENCWGTCLRFLIDDNHGRHGTQSIKARSQWNAPA